MEPEIIISDNEEYKNIIQLGIKDFNNHNHPEMEIFNLYRSNGYNNPFGFYAMLRRSGYWWNYSSKKDAMA